MRCLVTGAAGFIGSHLSRTLLHAGHQVVGVDAFIPYYPRALKEANLRDLREHRAFTFHELDLRTDDLRKCVADVDTVFHLGAMAGLSQSWSNFELYQSCNLSATQRLLEAVRGQNLRRFIYASTSSVYGKYSSGDEALPTRPISPYGVTKLAGEHLSRVYADVHGVPVVVLRYFSVYGPGQRPDMGYHKFIDAMLRGQTLAVYGDGQQSRGNTYISDCIQATMLMVEAPVGETFQVGGDEVVTVWQLLEKLQALTGIKPKVEMQPARAGDQRATFADCTKLRRHFGWAPKTTLAEGLAEQIRWQRKLLEA